MLQVSSWTSKYAFWANLTKKDRKMPKCVILCLLIHKVFACSTRNTWLESLEWEKLWRLVEYLCRLEWQRELRKNFLVKLLTSGLIKVQIYKIVIWLSHHQLAVVPSSPDRFWKGSQWEFGCYLNSL